MIVFAAALLVAGAAHAQPDPAKPPPPGVGGDAVLPAGLQGLRWGINDVALQQVLGRGLEMAPGMDHHRHWLIDTPTGADDDAVRGVVKFHFWDSTLFEVKVYYSLSAADGKVLVGRFEEEYGTATHDVVRNALVYGEIEASVAKERWQWKDPFTLMILTRELDGEHWSMVRQSRVLEDRRLSQQRKERESKRSDKVDSIQLD